MNPIKKLLNIIIRCFHTFRKCGLPTINDASADIIIWSPRFFTLKNLHGDYLQKELCTYYHFKMVGAHATIYTRDNIGIFSGKMIIYFASTLYEKHGFPNYTSVLSYLSSSLQAQGNIVFPNLWEVGFWENKASMHKIFENLKIRTPESIIVGTRNNDLSILAEQSYPLLIKEEHSCSSNGLHKVNSYKEAVALFNSKEILNANQQLVVQKLINIRRDLRVILVGEEIVWHYWRINLQADWMPTSTGNGSRVDFENFPENWREWIVSSFKKLNILTGAFDIAWDNDDLSNEPYILEVSPFYQPNPMPALEKNLKEYGLWKKGFGFEDSYQAGVVDIIFNVQRHFVQEFHNRYIN